MLFLGLVLLRHLRSLHCLVGVFHGNCRPIRELGIRLKLNELVASVHRAGGWLGSSRATCEQCRCDGHSNCRSAGDSAGVGSRDHFVPPVLRFISSTRTPVLRFMSSFTAMAFAFAVFAEASSASARASSANWPATIIRSSVTAAFAEASLVRAAPSSAAA